MKKPKIITKPGVYKGLSYAEYDAIPALRSTYLKKFLHCPASSQIPDEEKESFATGILSHCYTLEGISEFNKRYHVIEKYEGDKRKAEWKGIKEAALRLALVSGKTPIPFEDYEDIMGMDASIRNHPTAKLFLKNPEPEIVVVWKDKATGLLLKCRFDLSPYLEQRFMVDLKTTTTASERGFRNEILKWKYWFSAVMYLIGAREAMKENIDVFAFIAVEKKKPYRCEVHELAKEYIEEAHAIFHSTLKKVKACQESGVYPAYLNAGVIVQEKPASLIAE